MQNVHIVERLRDRDWAKAGLVMLSMLLTGVTVFALSEAAALRRANARVDAMTQKAFYETCELTEGMAVNFRKLLATGEPGQAQALLNEARLQAQGAMSNLALLPLGQDTVSATLKFINQAGDFAGALSKKLGEGGQIAPEDTRNLERLSETAAAFSVSLARLLDRYERGEAVFAADGAAQPSGDLSPVTDPAGAYPVLLYDGPFSDGRAEGAYRALEGLETVSEAQARERLTAFVGQSQLRGLTLTGEASIPVPCYEYSLRVGDYELSAGVTKAGGRVLYLLCDTEAGAVSLTQAEALDAARAFLIARDFGDMELSYSSLFGGILTANFAAVQDGVVLYPDLVKVQVSMKDGQIIGLEAAGYLMNHVPRALGLPKLTAEEAMLRVAGRLRAESARLAVIPENDSEVLCYEVAASQGDDRFLAYIDAATGAELELMQVVSDGGGQFVM